VRVGVAWAVVLLLRRSSSDAELVLMRIIDEAFLEMPWITAHGR